MDLASLPYVMECSSYGIADILFLAASFSVCLFVGSCVFVVCSFQDSLVGSG